MKTILLTGAAGFLGSNLLNKLRNNYNVIILEAPNANVNRIKEFITANNFYNSIEGNIEKIFKKNKIDIILHCATIYGKDNKQISSLINTNIKLPLQLIEYGIKYGSKLFINTDTFFTKGSSSYKYLDNYILSKRHLVEWLHKFYNDIQIFNLKLEHIFGFNDNEDKFIPKIIKKMLLNESEIELTEGNQKRDFIFVFDVVKAYEKIIENYSKIEQRYYEFEIGLGKSMFLRSFVELIRKISKSNSKLKFGAIKYRENEIMDSYANIENLIKIGWQPDYTVEYGLIETINKERIKYE